VPGGAPPAKAALRTPLRIEGGMIVASADHLFRVLPPN